MRIIHAQHAQLPEANTSDWIIVTSNAWYLDRQELRVASTAEMKPVLLWTDDFSSLWHLLK